MGVLHSKQIAGAMGKIIKMLLISSAENWQKRQYNRMQTNGVDDMIRIWTVKKKKKNLKLSKACSFGSVCKTNRHEKIIERSAFKAGYWESVH